MRRVGLRQVLLCNVDQNGSKKMETSEIFLLSRCPIDSKRTRFSERERYIALIPNNHPAPCFFSFNEAFSFCQGALATSASEMNKYVSEDVGAQETDHVIIDSDPCAYRAHRISPTSCAEISISQKNIDYYLYVDPYAQIHREREEKNIGDRIKQERENQETQNFLIKIGLVVFAVVIFMYMKP